MTTSGFAPPLSTSPQADGGRLPSRGAPATLTQAAPEPAASAWGAPMRSVAVTRFVRGSMREIRPSTYVAAHSAPSPNAR